MADQVESLTNADLQAKLAEYGFEKIPVTAGTRKTLERKLKSILENKNKSEKRKSNTNKPKEPQISKDEEITLEKIRTSEDKRSRRATTSIVETKNTNVSQKISHSSVQFEKHEENIQVISKSKIDEVDSMSDAELQAKLVEHGYPVVPITATTRNSLVKKLKLILENKSKPGKQNNKQIGNKQSDNGAKSHLQTTSKAKRNHDQIDTPDMNEVNKPPQKTLHASMDRQTPNISIKTGEKSVPSSPLSPSDTLDLIRSSLDITSSLANHLSAVSNYSSSSKSSLSQSSSPTVENSVSSERKSSALQSETTITRDLKDGSPLYSGVRNSIRSIFDMSSMRNSSPASNYTPNSTNTSISEDNDSESPFLSDFGKRLHAQKTKTQKTSF